MTGTHLLRLDMYSVARSLTKFGGKNFSAILIFQTGARGGAVVEALRYKPEGRGIDSRWCHWNFSLTLSFRLHYGPEVE
jgi:hypothetical protein